MTVKAPPYVSDSPFVMLDLANFTSINVSIADNTALVQTGADIGEVCASIT